MVRLSPTVIADLESEEAPLHVFRWVAWAATLTDQRRRTDLVIHLRRTIERPRNGWLEERHFYAAMEEWDQARSAARKRGGIMPAVHEIPLEAYRTAIEGVTRNERVRRPETETGATATESVEAGSEPSTQEIDDEGAPEEAPISDREPRGREHVLRLLSDAVRVALASQDVEAADVANDAISRLCRGRAVG